MNDKQKTYKLLSILLQYPEQIDDIKLIQREVNLLQNDQVKGLLQSFLNYYSSQGIDQLNRDYIDTFDFNTNTTMYLTYPEFSDSLERGEALLSIKRELEHAGYKIKANELSDYLPLILEFASLDSTEAAERILIQYNSGLVKLGDELKNLNSSYQFLMEAIILLTEELQQEDLKGGIL